MSDQQETKLN